MTLYLVEHTHTEETCPSNTPEGMKMMADLVLGKEHANRSGVNVVSDHLLKGKHRLLLFVEADRQENVEKFAMPFTMVGKAEVFELTRCEAVMQEVLAEQAAAKS